MGKKSRPSAKATALSKVQPGQVNIFKQRKRTRKAAAGGRETVGFSTQLVAAAGWSVVIDSRTLTRRLQIELGDWYTAALEQQVDPGTGSRLPKPRASKLKKGGQLGIDTGRLKSSWQLGKVTGKVSKSRGIVQPFADGTSGSLKYTRRFFLDYMLGKRAYAGKPVAVRNPKTGRFKKTESGAESAGNPRKYEHAPVDFQAVTGLAASIIQDAVSAFVNDSGLMTAGPLTPPPKYLGAGNLQKVKTASGISGGSKPKPI